MSELSARLDRFRDPLLERDYVRICSRPTMFRNRTLAALGTGLVFLIIYGSAGRNASNDEIGRNLHLVFTWLASFWVGSLAMSEAAVAIPTERATGTLTVLLTVPRTPRRLAVGFFLSRLFIAFTGLLAVLPVDGTALLLGGVSTRAFLLTMLFIVVTGIYGAALGLYAGYGAPSHRHALGRAGFLSFLVSVALPGLVAMIPPALRLLDKTRPLDEDTERLVYQAAYALFLASPLGALFHFTGAGIGIIPGLSDWIYLLPTGVAVAAAVGSVFLTGARLRDDTERTILAGGGPGPMAWIRRVLRFGRAPAAPGSPEPVYHGLRHSVWRRPLWWKESRPPRSGWARLALRAGFVVYFAFHAWLWFHPAIRENFVRGNNPDRLTPYDILVSLPLWILLLGTMAAGGTFLAEEREKKSLDHLRTAPLRPADFILARFVGVGMRIWPLFAISALFAAVGLVTGQVHFIALVAWTVGIAAVTPFLGLLCFWRGMSATTVRMASRRSGIVIATLLLGWPIAAGFLAATFHRIDEVFGMSLAFNPLVSAAGPFTLWASVTKGHWSGRDDEWFALLACAACVLWVVVGRVLWGRLPAALDRALHAGEEG